MHAKSRAAISRGVAIGLLGADQIRAVSLRTGSIQPGAGRKPVCIAVNDEAKPLRMQAQIVDLFGRNTIDFAATDYDASGTIVTTLRVESTDRDARYCRIFVIGGKKQDVTGSLRACAYDNSACGEAILAR